MDDLTIDAKDAASEKEQASLRMWYKQVAYNRLQKDGRIVLIGTRWREDDIQGWLLNPEEQERIDDWTIFRFPAIAEEDEEFRKQGEALWPAEFDLEALERIQSEERRAFAGLYQQRPSIETGNIIQRSWLKLEKLTDDMLRGPRIMALDTAFKEGSHNDYSAATIGQMCGSNIGVLYAEQKKLDFPKLILWIKTMVQIYGIRAILCEDAASGQSVIQTIRKELPSVPIIPIKIKRGEDKESLMHAICPFLESGRVVINKFAGVDTLLDNLLVFPAGAHDDLADSFRILINYMVNHSASLRKLAGRGISSGVPNIYAR
jgi:predicted phage terminase large subunit-like protein